MCPSPSRFRLLHGAMFSWGWHGVKGQEKVQLFPSYSLEKLQTNQLQRYLQGLTIAFAVGFETVSLCLSLLECWNYRHFSLHLILPGFVCLFVFSCFIFNYVYQGEGCAHGYRWPLRSEGNGFPGLKSTTTYKLPATGAANQILILHKSSPRS